MDERDQQGAETVLTATPTTVISARQPERRSAGPCTPGSTEIYAWCVRTANAGWGSDGWTCTGDGDPAVALGCHEAETRWTAGQVRGRP